MRDAFHSADAPLKDIERWFANDTRKGASATNKHARFYLMLLAGDPATLEPGARPKAATKSSTPKANKGSKDTGTTRTHASKAQDTRARETSGGTPESDHDEQAHHATGRARATRTFDPALHLDFHIHIAPDTPLELMQQTFAAMRKYLWPGSGEGDE